MVVPAPTTPCPSTQPIISYGDQQVNAVDAPGLHQFLGVGKHFRPWMPEQIAAYGFIEHKDFEVLPGSGLNPQGGRPTKVHMLSIDMAKELAMVQRTDKGKEARQYFIECERPVQGGVAKVSTSIYAIGDKRVNAVDARALHTFLGVGKVFGAWITEQITAYNFVEHRDFEVFTVSGLNPHGGRPTKDYMLSIDMVKELAMVQRTDKLTP